MKTTMRAEQLTQLLEELTAGTENHGVEFTLSTTDGPVSVWYSSNDGCWKAAR